MDGKPNILEKKMDILEPLHSREFFIMYNYFLMFVYIICAIRLFIMGIKDC